MDLMGLLGRLNVFTFKWNIVCPMHLLKKRKNQQKCHIWI